MLPFWNGMPLPAWQTCTVVVTCKYSSWLWKYLNWLFSDLYCPVQQYHTEEDDDYVVGSLNLLLALTLLGRDLDEDDEDYVDFPFHVSVEYD